MRSQQKTQEEEKVREEELRQEEVERQELVGQLKAEEEEGLRRQVCVEVFQCPCTWPSGACVSVRSCPTPVAPAAGGGGAPLPLRILLPGAGAGGGTMPAHIMPQQRLIFQGFVA